MKVIITWLNNSCKICSKFAAQYVGMRCAVGGRSNQPRERARLGIDAREREREREARRPGMKWQRRWDGEKRRQKKPLLSVRLAAKGGSSPASSLCSSLACWLFQPRSLDLVPPPPCLQSALIEGRPLVPCPRFLPPLLECALLHFPPQLLIFSSATKTCRSTLSKTPGDTFPELRSGGVVVPTT